jgi:uncharacterized membrane-anchored protein
MSRMTGMLSRPWAWVAVVALVQTAALGWMVYDRNRILAGGTEVVLPVIPVDPRSLFQGDYVRLGYDINQVQQSADARVTRTPVYVVLSKGADGTWSPVGEPSMQRPKAVPQGAVVLAGTQQWSQATFGIETFFVPEGKGPELEKLIGEKKLSAAVRVDASGRAALAGLLVDGQPAYREPWY